MHVKDKVLHILRTMSITTRFTLGVGLLLTLIVLVAATGYISLYIARNSEDAIRTSTRIRRLILEMDRGMERARHLHAEFFLQYPLIGLTAAHKQFAQPSVREVARVIATSHTLKKLISQSAVSEALQKSNVNLNLYLSLAKRFADTSIESVELVTNLAAPVNGLEAQMENQFKDLKSALSSEKQILLFNQMKAYVQDYRLHRKRDLMQSAFNTAFELRKCIASDAATTAVAVKLTSVIGSTNCWTTLRRQPKKSSMSMWRSNPSLTTSPSRQKPWRPFPQP